ncbi:MAG: SGNH/GDSL hydrolase family protein [Victivallales bacterium]|nr:SGNH/GDSL hydrolase family protein [Victivallales bacterium]
MSNVNLKMVRSLCAGALCATAANLYGETMIYSHPERISTKSKNWEFIEGGKEKETYNPAEGYYPNKGGKFVGPKIVVDKGEYTFFRLTFSAQMAEEGYWVVFFYDKEDNPIVADVYSSIYPSKDKMNYDCVVYGRAGMKSLQPLFQSKSEINVSDLKIERISFAAAADWCDQQYAGVPPLKFTPPAERMALLPKTKEAFKSGKPWRVVMLGDSIINDTFNSNFQALLKRDYPASNLEIICSVRGGTGCWHYQTPENFKTYVTDLKPDLLIIGGISHKSDAPAVASVIAQAQKYGCEIMLMTGPMAADWREYDKSAPALALSEQEWKGHPFIKELKAVANNANVEFFDMQTPWHEYLGASKKPWQWFHRDRVHANDRGKQILGRMLTAYLAP